MRLALTIQRPRVPGMGMIEEARISLARGKDGNEAELLKANAYASLAVAELLEQVVEELINLREER